MKKMIPLALLAVLGTALWFGSGRVCADVTITPIPNAATNSLRIASFAVERAGPEVTLRVLYHLRADSEVVTGQTVSWAITPSALPAAHATAYAVLRRGAAALLLGTPVPGYVPPISFTPVAVSGTIQ